MAIVLTFVYSASFAEASFCTGIFKPIADAISPSHRRAQLRSRRVQIWNRLLTETTLDPRLQAPQFKALREKIEGGRIPSGTWSLPQNREQLTAQDIASQPWEYFRKSYAGKLEDSQRISEFLSRLSSRRYDALREMSQIHSDSHAIESVFKIIAIRAANRTLRNSMAITSHPNPTNSSLRITTNSHYLQSGHIPHAAIEGEIVALIRELHGHVVFFTPIRPFVEAIIPNARYARFLREGAPIDVRARFTPHDSFAHAIPVLLNLAYHSDPETAMRVIADDLAATPADDVRIGQQNIRMSLFRIFFEDQYGAYNFTLTGIMNYFHPLTGTYVPVGM